MQPLKFTKGETTGTKDGKCMGGFQRMEDVTYLYTTYECESCQNKIFTSWKVEIISEDEYKEMNEMNQLTLEK